MTVFFNKEQIVLSVVWYFMFASGYAINSVLCKFPDEYEHDFKTSAILFARSNAQILRDVRVNSLLQDFMARLMLSLFNETVKISILYAVFKACSLLRLIVAYLWLIWIELCTISTDNVKCCSVWQGQQLHTSEAARDIFGAHETRRWSVTHAYTSLSFNGTHLAYTIEYIT